MINRTPMKCHQIHHLNGQEIAVAHHGATMTEMLNLIVTNVKDAMDNISVGKTIDSII